MEKTKVSLSQLAFLKRPLAHILLIIILGLLAYSNTFHSPFHFDDMHNISENPIVKNLQYFADPSEAKGFGLYDQFKSRFIGYLTFAMNYKLQGLDVTGYHIVNLSIHIINAMLIYWLVLLSFQTPILKTSNSELRTHLIALFSSLLFLSHPIQTQAVTYIVQRFASLATLFYLLSLVMYIKFRMKNTEARIQTEKKQRTIFSLKSALLYPASVIFAVLAMKTKEISATLPVMIMLYELMFFKGSLKRRFFYLIPLLLTMLIIPLTFLDTSKPVGDIIGDVSEVSKVQTTMSRWDYLFTEFRVIITYIRLLFVPINQNLDYDYPVYHSFFDPPVFLSFLFLSLLLILAFYLLRLSYQPPTPSSSPSTIHHSPFTSRYLRLISFGIFWFFITLMPESSFIPVVDVIFEHRVYLPSVGVFIAVSTSAFVINNALKSRWSKMEKAIATALTLIIFVLAGTTFARNIIWQDGMRLWEDIANKSPLKGRPHYNLGIAYKEQNRYEEAISEFQTAIKSNPDIADSYSSLGAVYTIQGRYEDAIREVQIAIRLNPGYAAAHNNMGVVYKKQSRYEDAIKEYQSAINLNPFFSDPYNNMGVIYANVGQYRMALENYDRAIGLNPAFSEAYNNRGIIHFKLMQYDMAIKDYTRAIALNAILISAYNNRGNAYDEKGLPDKAIEDYNHAIALDPNFSGAYYNRGISHEKLGLVNDAISDFQIACNMGHGLSCEALKQRF